MSKFKHPIDTIVWVERELLNPNNYNPNQMSKYDFELLIISILEDGWTQPIVINKNYEIVDGYHRWCASDVKRVKEKYGSLVPVVFTIPTDFVSQQISTIRHNRAKGTHGVFKMSSIVADMINKGTSVKDIMDRLQMEEEEVVKLGLAEGIPKEKIIAEHSFSNAWGPDGKK